MKTIKGPLELTVELTNNCNLACGYCYSYPIRHFNPSLNALKRLFDIIFDKIQPFELSLSGGEPFLRKDIVKIIKLAKEYTDTMSISTNGTLLKKYMKDIKRIEDSISLQVSIDSHIRSIHNRVRGKFEETLRTIRELIKEEIPFGIGIVVHRLNIRTVMKSCRFFCDMGVKNIHLMNLVPSIKALQNKDMLFVDDLQLEDFWGKLNETAKEWHGVTFSYLYSVRNKSHQNQQTLECSGCLAGVTRGYILPNGDVVPCGIGRLFVMGNIYQKPWHDIWNSDVAMILRSLPFSICSLNQLFMNINKNFVHNDQTKGSRIVAKVEDELNR